MKLINQIVLILVLSSLTGHSTYSFLFFNRAEQTPIDCCARECGASPLECGSYDVQFQAGIAPVRWNHADRINQINSFITSPTLVLFRHPHFSTLYRMPLIIGAQAGYAWSDHVRLYFEINYLKSKSKNDVNFVADTNQFLPASITLTNYKLFDAYLGGRYYTNRCWCDRVSFFLGGKIGFTRHRDNDFDLVVGSPIIINQTVLLDVPVFDNQTIVSGGINGGFDICCGNWSLVITGEVIINRGPKIADDLLVTPAISNIFSLIFFGNVGTELRFPITAGIRYTF